MKKKELKFIFKFFPHCLLREILEYVAGPVLFFKYINSYQISHLYTEISLENRHVVVQKFGKFNKLIKQKILFEISVIENKNKETENRGSDMLKFYLDNLRIVESTYLSTGDKASFFLRVYPSVESNFSDNTSYEEFGIPMDPIFKELNLYISFADMSIHYSETAKSIIEIFIQSISMPYTYINVSRFSLSKKLWVSVCVIKQNFNAMLKTRYQNEMWFCPLGFYCLEESTRWLIHRFSLIHGGELFPISIPDDVFPNFMYYGRQISSWIITSKQIFGLIPTGVIFEWKPIAF